MTTQLAVIKPPRWLVHKIVAKARQKPLDFIYGDDGSLYMERYQLMSWHNRFDIGIRLHITRRSDLDRHLHDHPWPNISWIFENGYDEELPNPTITKPERTMVKRRKEGAIIFRRAEDRHRLDLLYDYPNDLDDTEAVKASVSLFITFRWRNPWGFYVDGVKVPWRVYLANRKQYESDR